MEIENNASIARDDSNWRIVAGKMERLRLVAISSVIWDHSLLSWQQLTTDNPVLDLVQLVFFQLGRLGTIIFFLISGYFLGGKVLQYTVLSYLKSRYRTVIIPWILFLLLCVCIQVAQTFVLQQETMNTPVQWLGVIQRFLLGDLFYAAYWFVPVSVISGCLLVANKKNVYGYGFGAALFAITLIYNINLYTEWFTPNHTKAFLGYAFFMWIGIQIRIQVNSLLRIINRLPLLLFIIGFAGFLFLSSFEGRFLEAFGSGDPFGSIRFSNALAALCLVTAVLRNKSFKQQKQRSRTVYGMYLLHSVLLVLSKPLINSQINFLYLNSHPLLWIALQLIWFFTIFGLSYLIAQQISTSRWNWLIGVYPKTVPDTKTQVLSP